MFESNGYEGRIFTTDSGDQSWSLPVEEGDATCPNWLRPAGRQFLRVKQRNEMIRCRHVAVHVCAPTCVSMLHAYYQINILYMYFYIIYRDMYTYL